MEVGNEMGMVVFGVGVGVRVGPLLMYPGGRGKNR